MEHAFTVEINGARGWRPFSDSWPDLYRARESSAKLTASQSVETRVTDSEGQVWA